MTLDGRPNLVVDGPRAPGTVLTLSHWPHSATPKALARDLSAQIVFAYLVSKRRWPTAELVSNDHVDQDGLVSLFAITCPGLAVPRRGLLEDVASAGDFAVFSSRRAARISFAIAGITQAVNAANQGSKPSPDSHAQNTATTYAELLQRFPDLVDNPDKYLAWWREEDASYQSSIEALDAGEVQVEEVPALDLAVVTVGEGFRAGLCTRFTAKSDWMVHPAAICNATRCLRVLVVKGRQYQMRYRYESWVKLVTRKPLQRVDFGPLVDLLNSEESGTASWSFDAVGALEPLLRTAPGTESSLAPDRVGRLLKDHLGRAQPAWDPYSER